MNEETVQTTTGKRTLLLVVSGILLLAFGWMLANDSLGATEGSDKAARIGDLVITMAEVESEAATPPRLGCWWDKPHSMAALLRPHLPPTSFRWCAWEISSWATRAPIATTQAF